MKLNGQPSAGVTHVLSIDVEDYFQVEAFARTISRQSWDSYPLRIEENMRSLLDLLDEHSAVATFFFLGWIAHKLPQLVREVVRRGHEVACHSYWHHPVYSLTPAEFRKDTQDAIHVIEDAAGVAVEGYRAPTWSITGESLWALSILQEEGFLYDSSIYPVRHDLYGIPGARREPYAWRCGNGFLFEFPPATLRLGPVTAPAAGGGYLRIFPLAYTTLAIDRTEQAGGRAIVYLHPWELDPGQPRLAGSLKSRLRHYTGLPGMRNNLTALLKRYQFASFSRMWRAASVHCDSMSLPVLTQPA